MEDNARVIIHNNNRFIQTACLDMCLVPSFGPTTPSSSPFCRLLALDLSYIHQPYLSNNNCLGIYVQSPILCSLFNHHCLPSRLPSPRSGAIWASCIPTLLIIHLPTLLPFSFFLLFFIIVNLLTPNEY